MAQDFAKTCGLGALALVLATSAAVPAAAQTRSFTTTNIDVNLATDTADVDTPGVVRTASVNVAIVPDGTFQRLDMRIPLTEDTVDEVLRMSDQGYTAEPSRCAPGAYGPLDMEDGLRYFFEVDGRGANADRYTVTVYAGNRTTHWANDVYCEFDPETGESGAVLRISGFFYAIHRRLSDSVNVQLRAVSLSPEEVDIYLSSDE